MQGSTNTISPEYDGVLVFFKSCTSDVLVFFSERTYFFRKNEANLILLSKKLIHTF